ncbi:amidohydrolase family protein [Actimicrobium sp. CCC2.4]|uniref:amidohydrolase family protein n=1 Tax=Actimicrobium sp. CCC2.4 TaxID=3048606 RepID=UPI002AC90D19|nr:amidohydrolase family protein [Actimicrobium sp. CCC2.4]MEB0135288.1 amidohydrolase family protein [Actimicrobium sp. CCC2.4]WPX31079.1 amidohydrolase family protein [Actimicrobium sp. CCC2.4]
MINSIEKPNALTRFSETTDDTERCLAPLPDIESPLFTIPVGACDTHAHVVIHDPAHPMAPNRSYTPPAAPEDSYLAMLNAMRISRGVLIQISVMGTDNSYMLKVLRNNPDRLRGVAVVDTSITDKELLDMHEAGVRGLRINTLFGGGVNFDALEKLAPRVEEMGWNMQFLMDARQLPELMPRMRALPCTCVIDHMGHMPMPAGLDDPGTRALFSLVKDHGFWVKLSGAYRMSELYPEFPDVTPLARALIDLAPDRMVWGSDWPHVAIKHMPDTGHMLNLLQTWAPDEKVRNKILVDNPAVLYGF